MSCSDRSLATDEQMNGRKKTFIMRRLVSLTWWRHNYNDATQCQPASETVSHTKHVIIIIIIVVVIISDATTTIMLSVQLLASLIHRCIMFLSNDKQFTSNPDLSLTSCDLDL